jgi:hypothetical protein
MRCSTESICCWRSTPGHHRKVPFDGSCRPSRNKSRRSDRRDVWRGETGRTGCWEPGSRRFGAYPPKRCWVIPATRRGRPKLSLWETTSVSTARESCRRPCSPGLRGQRALREPPARPGRKAPPGRASPPAARPGRRCVRPAGPTSIPNGPRPRRGSASIVRRSSRRERGPSPPTQGWFAFVSGLRVPEAGPDHEPHRGSAGRAGPAAALVNITMLGSTRTSSLRRSP